MGSAAWLPCWLVLVAACAAPPSPPAAAQAASPRDFVGCFRGPLQLRGGSGAPSVTMQLLVEPLDGSADRLRWQLRYGEHDVRDYVLTIDDAATGRCTIDEQNGIALAGSFADGELVTVFEVGGQVLDCRYRLVGEGVEFALEAVDRGAGTATGQGVTTFAKVAWQRALLRRQ